LQRVWAHMRLNPHRLHRYMASNDPGFEQKTADTIGLYMNQPQHAAVSCVDEKTAIRALDRHDPVLPLSPGRAERHGFEYCRPGTLSLYVAMDVKTGQLEGMTAGRHTGKEFVAFLEGWVASAHGPSRSASSFGFAKIQRDVIRRRDFHFGRRSRPQTTRYISA
jgi:hypothetical protein